MKKTCKIWFLVLLGLSLLLLFLQFLTSNDMAVLNPKGMIAVKEKEIITQITLLMLIVLIPVFFILIFVSWKYRASNKKAKYDPTWDHSHLAESIWWGVPCLITLIFAWITWKGCHELDPFRKFDTTSKSLKIQVVALQWKWLFIYPEQGIASLNFVQFPEKMPIDFEITSDAPMNSFWIPQLGGQIYAMPGMSTKLHLIADEQGEFRGSSANLSGVGFAGMVFTAKASSEEEFTAWVEQAKNSSNQLTLEEYKKLVEPSEKNPQVVYRLQDDELYDWIVMKYMMPDLQEGKTKEGEIGCLEI